MQRPSLLLLLLIACDLQPAKQKKPADTVVAVPAPAPDAGVEPMREFPAGATVDAGLKAPPVKASDECITVAGHLSKLVIAALTDDNAKAAQQQDEARMIKSVAETCTKDKWTDKGRSCLLASKVLKDTEACNIKPPG